MKQLKSIFLFVAFLLTGTNTFAAIAELYPHELMFINCTQQPIYVSSGNILPYNFSMNPLVDAFNGYSPPYAFYIPPLMIYQHPITAFMNYAEGPTGVMHMYLNGGINSEIHITLFQNKVTLDHNHHPLYIKYKTDTRYIELLGYSYNHEGVAKYGYRSIIALGCSTQTRGSAGSPKVQEFFVRLR